MVCNKKVGDKIILPYTVPMYNEKYYYRVIENIESNKVQYEAPETWDPISQVNKSRLACTIDFIFYPYLNKGLYDKD